jgi:hypothetical protein
MSSGLAVTKKGPVGIAISHYILKDCSYLTENTGAVILWNEGLHF